ncbi:MAG: IS66 family transposase [Acetobacteraceae bacterium]|nr:IS66 family transposase [Acetobacteraceae bacterium]
MSIDPLPEDLSVLRALVGQLSEEKQQLIEEVEKLRRLLKKLRDEQFGKRSERRGRPDRDQILLALEDLETAAAKQQAEELKNQPAEEPAKPQSAEAEAQTRNKRKTNRGSLPAHLPRIHETIEPECKDCPHGHGPMHVIGEDTSERLDVIPAQRRVVVTHRPKFGCRTCESAVVQAPAPERLIKNGIPTEPLVAAVITDKYAWHLPLYRQAEMMKLEGIPIDRSTLADWVGTAAAELTPVYQRLKENLLDSPKIVVDETPVPVLDPGGGRTKTGYFWTISRDDRPWGGPDPAAVAYTYAPGRGGEHLITLLAGYSGIVHCDGYAAYKQLVGPKHNGQVILAFCWTHWRREFYDITRSGPAPIAEETLERIAKLYAIEQRIRGSSAEQRLAVRQAESKPIVEDLKTWLEKKLVAVSQKSSIAEAIRYGFNHWDGLVRFLEDGRIEMDTNSVERQVRPIKLNRKNALFAGHDEGASNWACLSSLIQSAKLHRLNPQTYLADVLTKLVNGWPMKKLDELLPWAWAKQNSENKLAA